MTSSAIRAHPRRASTQSRLVLTQRLRPARLLFQLLRSLPYLDERRHPCGQRDRSSRQLLRRPTDLLVHSLLCFIYLDRSSKKSSCYNLSIDSYGHSCRHHCRGCAFVHRRVMDLSLRHSRASGGKTTHLLPDQAPARKERMDHTCCCDSLAWLQRIARALWGASRVSLLSSISHHYTDTNDHSQSNHHSLAYNNSQPNDHIHSGGHRHFNDHANSIHPARD